MNTEIEKRWVLLKLLIVTVLLLDWINFSQGLFWSFGPHAVLSHGNFSEFTVYSVYGLVLITYLLPLIYPKSEWPSLIVWVVLMGLIQTNPTLFYGLHTVSLLFIFLFVLQVLFSNKDFIWKSMPIFLSLIYFNAGIGKLLTPGWHSGAIVQGMLWNHFPDLELNKTITNLLQFLAIGIQVFHFLHLFFPKSRRYMLGLIIPMHLLAGIFLEHYLISFFMIGLNLVFLTSAQELSFLNKLKLKQFVQKLV